MVGKSSAGRASDGNAAAAADEALARIERRNGDLNAFSDITPDHARADAERADRLAAAGTRLGPLHGVPICVKDIIDLASRPTHAGSLTRKDAGPAVADAHVVRLLRAAGAVVVGKTNTVEYAFGSWGTNVTVGTPRNPWDLKQHRTPGGSSSGTGVAVGAGLVPAGLGTDTGGSVRIPAALNGCVGLKTSFGLVGRSGVVPLSMSLDSVGPLTDTVRRAAEMLAAMQGEDAGDRATHEPSRHRTDPLRDLERGISGLRLGRVADEDMPLLSAEMRAAFEAALDRLRGLGAVPVPFRMPRSFDDYGRRCGLILGAECYSYYRRFVDDPKAPLGGPVRRRMEGGKVVAAADYLNEVDGRPCLIEEFLSAMDRCDALIMPTTPIAAVPLAEVDESRTTMATHTRFANYLELAGLAVPMSLTRAGLPTSLQIVVRKLEDGLALRIGHAFEKARGAFPAPPAAA